MIRFAIGVIVGAVAVLVLHSKMSGNTEAEVNKTVGAQVDTAGTVALDGVQTGLNKANTAITDARKPGKK